MRGAKRDLTAKLKTLDSAAPSTTKTTEAASSEMLTEELGWTNAEGKNIRAAVKSLDGDNVTFLMSTGKEVSYPIAKLSKESQTQIKALQ